MDNAIDLGTTRTKGIDSLEASNMLSTALSVLAQADAAGLGVSACVPVSQTSFADNDRSRLGFCALPQLYLHWRQTGLSVAIEQAP